MIEGERSPAAVVPRRVTVQNRGDGAKISQSRNCLSAVGKRKNRYLASGEASVVD